MRSIHMNDVVVFDINFNKDTEQLNSEFRLQEPNFDKCYNIRIGHPVFDRIEPYTKINNLL